jgi:hypothetical protein
VISLVSPTIVDKAAQKREKARPAQNERKGWMERHNLGKHRLLHEVEMLG